MAWQKTSNFCFFSKESQEVTRQTLRKMLETSHFLDFIRSKHLGSRHFQKNPSIFSGKLTLTSTPLMTKISDDFGDLQGPIFSFGLSGRDPIGKQKIPGPGAYELAQVWIWGGLGEFWGPRCPSPNRENGEGNLLDFKKCCLSG